MPAVTDFVVIARLTEGKPWQSHPLSLRAFCSAEGVAI